eukprot:4554008-Prymnesium_polylepis.3
MVGGGNGIGVTGGGVKEHDSSPVTWCHAGRQGINVEMGVSSDFRGASSVWAFIGRQGQPRASRHGVRVKEKQGCYCAAGGRAREAGTGGADQRIIVLGVRIVAPRVLAYPGSV